MLILIYLILLIDLIIIYCIYYSIHNLLNFNNVLLIYYYLFIFDIKMKYENLNFFKQ